MNKQELIKILSESIFPRMASFQGFLCLVKIEFVDNTKYYSIKYYSSSDSLHGRKILKIKSGFNELKTKMKDVIKNIEILDEGIEIRFPEEKGKILIYKNYTGDSPVGLASDDRNLEEVLKILRSAKPEYEIEVKKNEKIEKEIAANTLF